MFNSLIEWLLGPAGRMARLEPEALPPCATSRLGFAGALAPHPIRGARASKNVRGLNGFTRRAA